MQELEKFAYNVAEEVVTSMEQQERKVGILMVILMLLLISGTQNESSVGDVSTDAFGIIDVVVWFEPKRREKRYFWKRGRFNQVGRRRNRERKKDKK